MLLLGIEPRPCASPATGYKPARSTKSSRSVVLHRGYDPRSLGYRPSALATMLVEELGVSRTSRAEILTIPPHGMNSGGPEGNRTPHSAMPWRRFPDYPTGPMFVGARSSPDAGIGTQPF